MQLSESGDLINAAFSQKVKDSIRIRRRQLVAVNTEAAPAEISWRWFIGEVESADGALASVRRLDLPAGSSEEVPIADGQTIAPGDLVFYGHSDSRGVVSRVANGQPVDPSAVATRYLPEVAARLGS